MNSQDQNESTPGQTATGKGNFKNRRPVRSQQFTLRQTENEVDKAGETLVVEVVPAGASKTEDLDARPNMGSRLDRLLTDGLIEDAVAMLKEALSATKLLGRGINASVEPDWFCRIKAAELLLAYAEGQPIKRTQSTEVKHLTLSDFQRQVSDAPAAQSALAEVLEMMKVAAVQKTPENSSGKTDEKEGGQ